MDRLRLIFGVALLLDVNTLYAAIVKPTPLIRGLVLEELIMEKTAPPLEPEFAGVPPDLACIIREASRRYDIDRRLLVAVARRESDFRRRLVSPVGARGVMQLMPETARSLGVRNCFDARQNIFGGARYLKQLDEMFDGNVTLILAAYNAGPGAVRKHRGIPPYRETRAYVASIRRELAMRTD